MTTGMLLGKFMPPHLGHVYLCEFARGYVDELTIVVASRELAEVHMPQVRRHEFAQEHARRHRPRSVSASARAT